MVGKRKRCWTWMGGWFSLWLVLVSPLGGSADSCGSWTLSVRGSGLANITISGSYLVLRRRRGKVSEEFRRAGFRRCKSEIRNPEARKKPEIQRPRDDGKSRN